MNYFTRLIREMNVKYECDNSPFLTMEETERIREMFKGLLLYRVFQKSWAHFNIDYLENH